MCKAEFLALSKDEQFAYQIDLKSRLDYKNAFDYAKKMAEEEGRKKEKIEITKNLLNQNIDLNIIVISTGLSVEEIKKI